MRTITWEEWKRKPADYKCVRPGADGKLVRMMLSLEPEGTCLVPVRVLNEQGEEVPILKRLKKGEGQ